LGQYGHVPSWEPPDPRDLHLDLEGEPDIDPDEIDLAEWERELSTGEP
jgi:hypothetical protein